MTRGSQKRQGDRAVTASDIQQPLPLRSCGKLSDCFRANAYVHLPAVQVTRCVFKYASNLITLAAQSLRRRARCLEACGNVSPHHFGYLSNALSATSVKHNHLAHCDKIAVLRQ